MASNSASLREFFLLELVQKYAAIREHLKVFVIGVVILLLFLLGNY